MGSISRIHVGRLCLFPITSDKGTYFTSVVTLTTPSWVSLGRECWKGGNIKVQELKEEGAGNEA